MMHADDIAARRAQIAASEDLSALRDRLVARAAPVIATMPLVPSVKALLSRDGGSCPVDGSVLVFDPWSPQAHRCPTCDRVHSGERHHAHWARAQHLWLAERAAHLATVHAITGDTRAGQRAREIVAAYFGRYFELPNSDNVLGPSHLFFSTYLESIWILDYLAAAALLREGELLSDADVESINAIADEAATIIGEFDEGLSNRQSWNAAALTAIAVWFGDEDLAATAITGRTGLLGHLADGFGDDGMWHEGENYHLFAMRGLLIGLHWAGLAGADLLTDPEIAGHLGSALMAPSVTALPDLTFPARKDSRYGVSLAHPAYVESWEVGAAMLGERAPADLDRWLHALYAVPPRHETTYDAYLHEAGEVVASTRQRSDLSWWALWTIRPALDAADASNAVERHEATLLAQQGVAIVRDGSRYVALECSGGGGGHGHPDRLHLTLFDHGVHWLPDPGTGSYVTDDLFWYRSTLAHNAPAIDGRDQPRGLPAMCTAFDSGDGWSHVRTEWEGIERTIITGPRWVVDIVVSRRDDGASIHLPWHLAGLTVPEVDAVSVELDNRFITNPRRIASGEHVTRVTGTARDRTAALYLHGGEVLAAECPATPGTGERTSFVMQRAAGVPVRLTTVIDTAAVVVSVEPTADGVQVQDEAGVTSIAVSTTATTIVHGSQRIVLGGMKQKVRSMPTIAVAPVPRALAAAMRVDAPPALDGTLDGFDLSEPLTLDDELCYFRTETPYPGPDAFSATAWVNWDVDSLYLAVDVVTDSVVIRDDGDPPLLLDNESDDIHSDGIQVYYRRDGDDVTAVMIRPAPDGIALRGIEGPMLTGTAAAWSRTVTGYCITARLPCPGLAHDVDRAPTIHFDILVNEMLPGRVRRAGQLAWSGGPGWAYLRGDRHDPSRFGALELHQ